MSKYPVIVLDGPDGTGKSTLAQELCQKLDAKYLHLTYRWPKNMFDYHTAALFYVLRQAQERPVVLDRWWMSEIVYADAYRGGSKWPLAHRLFQKAALRHNFLYVFCLPQDKPRYLQHFNELKGRRTEMFDAGMDKVYDGFEKIVKRFMRENHPSFGLYDLFHSEGSVDLILEWSSELRKRDLVMLNAPTNFMNLTGHPSQAKYLFVGDELKPKTRREVWPFFEYGNSSLYLAETFEKLEVPEHELMFMNINHPWQKQTNVLLQFIAQEYRHISIVPMGKEARVGLNSLGINFNHELAHPQYYRRFNREQGLANIHEVLRK